MAGTTAALALKPRLSARAAGHLRWLRRHPTILAGLRAARADAAGGAREPAVRDPRPDPAQPHRPPPAAFLGKLVRHRPARPRRLQPGDLRQPDLPPRRLQRRRAQHGSRARDRPGHRLHPPPRCDRDADHGRPDGDPGDPARDRADLAQPIQRQERDHRDHDPRGAADGPPGPQRRPDPARAAVRRCRGLARRPAAPDSHVPHHAQHGRAGDRAGDLRLRLGDHHRGDPGLSRRRHPARDPELGQHHGRGPDLRHGRDLGPAVSRAFS